MVKIRIFYKFDEHDCKDLELSRMPCIGEKILIGSLYTKSNGDVVQRWFCQTCRKGFNPTLQAIPESTSETSAVHPKDVY